MKYYCIGIKGSGMTTLACLLSDLGYEVSGYDDVKDFQLNDETIKYIIDVQLTGKHRPYLKIIVCNMCKRFCFR